MTTSAQRKRDLLKPPEIKPVLTGLILLITIGFVGDPSKGFAYDRWVFDHAMTAQKFFTALEKSDMLGLIGGSITATLSQLGPLSFALNAGFLWILGSLCEKTLIAWRYPLYVFLGILGSWAILAYGEFATPTQRFIGPSMFFFYMLGGFLVFKPNKPFKPAEWKKLPWKVYDEDNEHDTEKKRMLRLPWVSPWVYVTIFLAYQALLYLVTSMGGTELVNVTHIGLMGNLRRLILGTVLGDTVMVFRPIAAVQACLLGVFMSYILINIKFKSKMRREAGEMQMQAILQYKELRALDMNHKQAVEGTAKLIGVPLDVCKDWIAKGLQPQEKKDKQY